MWSAWLEGIRLHRWAEICTKRGTFMGCRETAVGGDPFKWNKQDRRMAFQGVGGEYDDMVAFPRARMAMMEAGRA